MSTIIVDDIFERDENVPISININGSSEEP
jgi:hypothetical protein